MNKQRVKELIKEFKTSFNNKEFKPFYIMEYGTKIEGELNYIHFVFYSMLRNKRLNLGCKNEHSPKLDYRKAQLRFLIDDQARSLLNDINYKYNLYYQEDKSCIFNSLKKIFPSITLIEAQYIISHYYENNQD